MYSELNHTTHLQSQQHIDTSLPVPGWKSTLYVCDPVIKGLTGWISFMRMDELEGTSLESSPRSLLSGRMLDMVKALYAPLEGVLRTGSMPYALGIEVTWSIISFFLKICF